MIKESQKQLISTEVKNLAKKSSQGRVAKKAQVSTATISQMINQNWELISDELWTKVRLNLHINWGWQTAEIRNFKLLNQLLKASQSRSMSICVSHSAGAGKSHTYKRYERVSSNVIYIECKNYWTKKSYVKHLLTSSGLDANGTVETLIERFIAHLKTLEKPLVILDQFDKLKDSSMDLFMDFYNDLDGHCGFVLSGVPALEKRIERGCQFDRIGFKELKSRIGRKYIRLDKLSPEDVSMVCKVNGLEDPQIIQDIYNCCEGDLRRVRRSIEQYFLLQKRA